MVTVRSDGIEGGGLHGFRKKKSSSRHFTQYSLLNLNVNLKSEPEPDLNFQYDLKA